jgi:phage tail sheath protein FI
MAADPVVTVELIEPPPATALPQNLPANFNGALANGQPEDLTTLADVDFIDAVDTLRQIDDVNLIAVPDCLRLTGAQGTPLTVQDAVRTHCEQMADRFAVLDAQPGLPLFGAGSIETQRAALDSVRGYAALYYPWVRVRPAAPGPPILVPPSGHVCGLIARTDITRGVHKAPANEALNGTLGVETMVGDVEQGQLNLKGINVIRVFQTGGRPVLWGARTTATTVDNNWMYVNVRRLFLFVEESIQEGIRWAVFEPNNTGLWQKLRRSISDFLTRVWRDGALFGDKAEDAFYVRIDEALNPDSQRALGRLTIEIGMRPSYPAEFIIVRIGIWQGGSEVTES